MRILLLLLALLLGSCSTTQAPAPITEEEAHHALVEVLRLAASGMDSAALTSLPLSSLLTEEQLHLLELDDIPLLPQRLEAWRGEVLEAYRSTARALADELDGLFASLTIEDARQVVQSKSLSATSILKAQMAEEIRANAGALLRPALEASRGMWRTISERHAIWRRSRMLLKQEVPPPLADDPFEQLLTIFIDGFLAALEREEMLLRTTPVVKGSGSILEVFQ